MKKSLFSFVISGLMFLAAMPLQAQVSKGSSFTESDLNTIVKIIDRQCPISLGSSGEIRSCKMTTSNLVMECVMDEEYIDLDALRKNPKLVHSNIESMVRNATGYTDSVYTLLAQFGKGVVLNYTGAQSGKKLSVSLKNGELKEIIKTRSDKRDPLELLQGIIEITNIQMPMTVDDGLVISDVAIDGAYVVYNCVTDEDLYSIDDLNDAVTEMKEAISEVFDLTDITILQLLRYCAEANKGIAYRYVGNQTGKTCFVPFSAREIRRLIGE